MRDFLDFIGNNWDVLSSAPLVFATVLLLSFGGAYLVARWRYESIVESLRERIASLKERIDAKDDQLDDYRERLHLVPSSGTAFSQLTNAELKDRALEAVQDMRKFLADHQESRYKQIFGTRRSDSEDMTEAQRQKAWERETQEMARDSLRVNLEWDARFKADSIILRDELLARLPAEAKNEREYRTYEHPTNPIGMGMVADDLDRLAKILPERAG